MGKTVITFMLVLCFITTSMGIGYATDFFSVGSNVLSPVVTVVNKVGDIVYDMMNIGMRPVPEGVFYFARWYFGDTEQYYLDLVYEFKLGIPDAYPVGGNVKVREFSNDSYQHIYVTTDKGWFHYSGEIFYDKYMIDSDIYSEWFRGKYMTRTDFYKLIPSVVIEK